MNIFISLSGTAMVFKYLYGEISVETRMVFICVLSNCEIYIQM